MREREKVLGNKIAIRIVFDQCGVIHLIHLERKKLQEKNKTEILNHSCFLWVRHFFLKAFIEVKASLTVERFT